VGILHGRLRGPGSRSAKETPHTPVGGVGNNFHYAGTMEEWGESPVPMLGLKGWRWVFWNWQGGSAALGRRLLSGKLADGDHASQREAGFYCVVQFPSRSKALQGMRGPQQLSLRETENPAKKLLKKLFSQGVKS